MVCWVAFASSFAPYYWLYAIFRFFIGFGLGEWEIYHVSIVVTWYSIGYVIPEVAEMPSNQQKLYLTK